MVKKGIFFTIDALIAAMLILSVILLLPVINQPKAPINTANFYASDIINLLSTLKLNEVKDPALQSFLAEVNITDYNRTIIEQILRFTAEGDNTRAEQIINLTIGNLIPDIYDFGIFIKDPETNIFSTGNYTFSNIASAKSLVSGFEVNRSVEGLASRALLANINERKNSQFVYFGGYEGDGILTKKVVLPNYNQLLSVFFEMDIGGDVTIYINDNNVGTFVNVDNQVEEITLNTSSLSYFIIGENNITFEFEGIQHFIGGGYIKVDYTTTDIYATKKENKTKHFLSGVSGIINLYDSIYVPGNLSKLDIYLNLNSTREVFLTIGNTTVYNDTPGQSTITLSDTLLKTKLDYSEMGDTTIPIRIGLTNVSYYTVELTGSADTVLVTDVSGSMDDCGEYSTSDMCGYDCCILGVCPDSYSCMSNTCSNEECGACPYYPQTCSYECTWIWGGLDRVISCESETCSNEVCGDCGGWRTDSNYQSYSGQSSMTNNISYESQSCTKNLMDIAKEADIEFINTVLEIPENNVGLVSYSSAVVNTHSLSDDNESLIAEVNTYDPDGGTCICCGVIQATTIINSQSSNNRTKAMLIMTDGEANRDCNIDPVADYDNDGDTSRDPQDHAIQSACDAFNIYNITVYTVGFGDIDIESQDTLQQMANCGGGEFRLANITDLAEIYTDIAQDIVNLSYLRQTVLSSTNLHGDLFSDSHINFSYIPAADNYEFGRIPLTIETPKLGNDITEGSFIVPTNMLVNRVIITSYSGDEWTDRAQILKDDWTSFYNLSLYNEDYHVLGDPYIVDLPVQLVDYGENKIRINTGPNPQNGSGGSPDNRIIYSGGIDLDVNYTSVFDKAEGCLWFIEFEDNTNVTVKIPEGYLGDKTCSYNSEIDCQTLDDAIDNSVCQLLSQFDFDNNGKLFVKFGVNDLKIETFSIGKIPYLWGPAVVEARVWR